MKGEDLGADWGTAPASDDLGANWGASVTRKSRIPKGEEGKHAKAAAAAAMPAAQAGKTTSLARALSPANAQAQMEGRGIATKQYASLKDLLTLPGRAAFAAIQGAGELAGSRDISKAFEAAKAAAANPQASFEESAPFMPTAQKYLASPRQFAEMAADPLAIPGMMFGGSAIAVRPSLISLLKASARSPIGAGLALGGARAGMRKGEYVAGMSEDPTTISAGDLLPAGIGGGVSLAARAAASGPQARQFAADLIRRAGKPTTDPEVLEAGNKFLVEERQLPNVVRGAWLPEGIARNFYRAMRPAIQNVGKQARLADEAGGMVNMEKAVKSAESSLRGQQNTRSVVLSEPEIEKSLEWMRSRALVPDEAMRAKLAAADIPHQGATVPLIGKEQLWAPLRREGSPVDETVVMGSRPRIVERLPILDEKGVQLTGKDLSPQFRLQATPADPGKNIQMKGYFAENRPLISEMSPAEILQNAPQMRQFIKEGKFPAGDRDIVAGYHKLPDYQGPIPDIELPVSKAWNVQRGMQKMAYKNEPGETTLQAGRVAAAKSIDQALRKQFAEVAPDLLAAKDRAAPYLAAEPYFASLERRANNYHLTPWEAWRSAHIKGAQGIWNASNLLDMLRQNTKGAKVPSYAPEGSESKERRK